MKKSGKQTKIKPDLRNAAEVFREHWESMKKRGLLTPEFKRAFVEAAEKVAARQRADLAKLN